MNLHNIPREQPPIPQTVYDAMWGLYKELRLRRFRYNPNTPTSLFVEEYIDRDRPAWTLLADGYWNRRGRQLLEENRLEPLDKSVFDIEIVFTEEDARRR